MAHKTGVEEEAQEAPHTYRGMDRERLDVEYNNRAVVPDWQGYLDRWRARSTDVYRRASFRDLPYGPGARQRLDLFLGEQAEAPTVLFLHGGYWQWNDKEGQAFVAEGLLAQGVSVAIGEYTLAPAASMDEICAEATAQVHFLSNELKRLGRSGELVLCGISTGAHLMATALGHPSVRAALLISGIYDLEPIRISSLNDAIGMDEGTARRHSPLHGVPDRLPRIVLAHGAVERPEICRQSADYCAALTALGHRATLMPIEGCDHFSVLEELAAPSGRLAQVIQQLAHPQARGAEGKNKESA